VSVRFAWSQTARPNLINQSGSPAASFRTDRWPVFDIE
jgi:sialate O-acetylesterase